MVDDFVNQTILCSVSFCKHAAFYSEIMQLSVIHVVVWVKKCVFWYVNTSVLEKHTCFFRLAFIHSLYLEITKITVKFSGSQGIDRNGGHAILAELNIF
jgi:hypothetical protein